MATLEIGQAGDDKLLLHDPAIKQGPGCVSPVVTLEFSGRATGEPHQVLRWPGPESRKIGETDCPRQRHTCVGCPRSMTRGFDPHAAFGKPPCCQDGHRQASRGPASRLAIRVAAFKLFAI